ncbi:hypothetical protein J5N97_018607 [Dioscorea zingiberensis]|uniref:BP28 C-terminal domain-containing protein n=1 Tax=Dioscorea zingiberensis TaxID=325984 RepID=A0A9D5CCG1_9LILI|nr:hypothetical protein J5N97_018607 [Dioscorea zingiberensis]
MATALASQIREIKAVLRGSEDPLRRPITRPSILFDPKEAADIDLRSILSLALSGLDVLIELDNRFSRYRNTLFSHTSLEVDREKMVPKEEEKLNISIRGYLRLLSGYLQTPAALKTLEYLIRRYKVHVLDVDELILCALPYHDTHAFVRIVQLLDLGNSKWTFLEGVKASGAPPPRKIIVQQSLRDKGILETICNYGSPVKEFQHSRPVICFCTAVIVEALGGIPRLDTDTVKRVINFVFDGLNPDMRSSQDLKAGALMVVGLLATRATLAPKLVQNLILFIARVAQQDSMQSPDISWLRVVVMAMVSLVQAQSTQMFPKKTMMILKDIRDFAAILSGLSLDFNIQKFLCLYLETLVDYSMSDESCHVTLVETMEKLPLKDFVERIVFKVLGSCMKLSRKADSSKLHDAGIREKQLLLVIGNHYPCELQAAVCKFLENFMRNSTEEESVFDTFCHMFDGQLDVEQASSDSKIWFSLEHPKAVVRQATLSRIAASDILKEFTDSSQKLINIQDAILRRLYDDELNVVQAALSVDGLYGLIDPARLFRAYQDVLSRSVAIIEKSTSKSSQASDAAILCLVRLVTDFGSQSDYSKEVATMLFPFLLVLPKTWRVALKVRELIKQVEWSFYHDKHIKFDPASSEQIKGWNADYVNSINLETIDSLAKALISNPQKHTQWLVNCSNTSILSKNLFLLVILRSLMICNEVHGSYLALHEACFPALTHEWHEMESRGIILPSEEFNVEKLDKMYMGFVDQLFSANVDGKNPKIMIYIFWSLVQAYAEPAYQNSTEHCNGQLLDALFCFFAKLPSKNAFRKHLHFFVTKCSKVSFQFLSKYFTDEGFHEEVKIESLNAVSAICSLHISPDLSSVKEKGALQLLFGFPSLLVPLSDKNKVIRAAAVSCTESLLKLWRSLDVSRLRNGNDMMMPRGVSTTIFGDFLESIVYQKNLIISDAAFLSSFLTSMLSPCPDTLRAPENVNKRFDQSTKDGILFFILSSALKLSSYGKLTILSLLKGVGSVIFHVEGLKLLLFQLLETYNKYCIGLGKDQNLSTIELETLCLLLKIYLSRPCSGDYDADVSSSLIKSLKVDGLSSEDQALVRPCVTVMENLSSFLYDHFETDVQDEIFGNLVVLFRNDNGYIRNAARETLLRINVNPSTIVRLFEVIIDQDQKSTTLKRTKRKKYPSDNTFRLSQDLFDKVESSLSLLGSLLDILLLKKEIIERSSLLQPLFMVLEKLFSNDWLQSLIGQSEEGNAGITELSESNLGALCHAQQTTLIILKDIFEFLSMNPHMKDDKFLKNNLELLINCARSAKDVITRNHVFMLLSSVARVSSGWLLEHIVDIFSLIGESSVKQGDCHSQAVLEELIATLVPCWLSKSNSIERLLQIFITALPDIAEHRRLTLMVYLLRTLGEDCSLGILFGQVFLSLIGRVQKSFPEHAKTMNELLSSNYFEVEWEYMFVVQLCNQYSCKVWLPCLVNLLEEIRKHTKKEEQLPVLCLSMHFILHKLHDTELVFELDSGKTNHFQSTFEALMEQIVLLLQLVHVGSKRGSSTGRGAKELKELVHGVLMTITKWMAPSTYFRSITQLLVHPNDNVKKKTLGLLCESVRDASFVQKNHTNAKLFKQRQKSVSLHIDESSRPSFHEMCFKIVKLIDRTEDNSETPVKLAAISSLEVLAKEFPSDDMIFITCLQCVAKYISSTDMAISSGSLRATGALICVLGSKALSQLPHVMKNMLQRAHEVSTCPIGRSGVDCKKFGLPNFKVSILNSILVTLKAIIESLGRFLNPYLEDVLDIMVLHPEYALDSDTKIKSNASTVRKLLTEKIPVRVMLTPLLKIYSSALKCGEFSLTLEFEMLANMISSMDRSSIASYHAKVFEQCILALDLRHQLPESIKDVNMVEENVIHAIVTLTMKLTETMFRPLFFRSLEWADSQLEGSELRKIRSIDRSISFYKLVHKLIEHHRSLFVPYFKYLVDGCTHYLSEDPDADVVLAPRRKKAKVGDTKPQTVLSSKLWHLRSLILKCLYKCFLYDSSEQKFLDSSNFQVLLKPIVSQFVVELPTSLEPSSDAPSVEEVNELIVVCLGQMAVYTSQL